MFRSKGVETIFMFNINDLEHETTLKLKISLYDSNITASLSLIFCLIAE